MFTVAELDNFYSTLVKLEAEVGAALDAAENTDTEMMYYLGVSAEGGGLMSFVYQEKGGDTHNYKINKTELLNLYGYVAARIKERAKKEN